MYQLSVQNVTCIRDDRVLFEDLNFTLESGQVLQVEGHNGSGKTSLLRILCGLTKPVAGEVQWQQENIENCAAEYRAALQYIGHYPGVKGDLTALENLQIARALGAMPSAISPLQALAQIGLYGFEDMPARTLSAGQQRRIALARLLINQAPMWILDEPFTALDKTGIANVESLLDAHATNGGLAVITSHHPVRCTHARQIYLGAI